MSPQYLIHPIFSHLNFLDVEAASLHFFLFSHKKKSEKRRHLETKIATFSFKQTVVFVIFYILENELQLLEGAGYKFATQTLFIITAGDYANQIQAESAIREAAQHNGAQRLYIYMLQSHILNENNEYSP